MCFFAFDCSAMLSVLSDFAFLELRERAMEGKEREGRGRGLTQ